MILALTMDFTETYPDTFSSVTLAIRAGNKSGLLTLIRQGKPLDVPDNRGWRPIHEAAAAGNVQCLQMLVNHFDEEDVKDELNQRTFEGETPLFLAAKAGHHDVVSVLLQNEADPNIPNNEDGSSILQAVCGNHIRCVEHLTRAGADLNAKYYNGWTPLHEAASQGNVAITEYLLNANAHIGARDDHGIQPVFVAAQYGKIDCLNMLLDRGGNINSQAQDKATPLYIATQENYVDIVKVLLERGASPKILVEDGYLPIHVAAYKGHTDCLELLLVHYDTYTTLDCPDTPLHLAIEGGQRETVKFLIEHGFDVNTGWKLPPVQLEKVRNTRPHFLPPLTMAVMERQKDLVQDMLAIGASANCRDFPPVTAYKCPFYAAFPSINILDVLLKHCKGARCPHSKWTMFRVFSRSKDLEAIQFLLDRGQELEPECDDCSDDTKGYCPLKDYAVGQKDFFEALVRLWWEYISFQPRCKYVMDALKPHVDCPRSLMHLSRMVVRERLGPHRLFTESAIRNLPIPNIIQDYLLHR
ncbi:ankyrin repeat and SOCS box protein 3-like [Lytechinus pictus]|uniref:ankyrin repeat and SOCS box protein 3-like n=1 Tax=Lytechinus pictus TaxID=7653 RepID=UPI00240E4757|nr:ankyrin repeat and SOCS box protein 3-like [Lytechinus pictus]